MLIETLKCHGLRAVTCNHKEILVLKLLTEAQLTSSPCSKNLWKGLRRSGNKGPLEALENFCSFDHK